MSANACRGLCGDGTAGSIRAAPLGRAGDDFRPETLQISLARGGPDNSLSGPRKDKRGNETCRRNCRLYPPQLFTPTPSEHSLGVNFSPAGPNAAEFGTRD